MHLNDRVSRLPRRAAVMAAAVPAALLVAGLATGVASAAPGDDITGDCLEMSQDGVTWFGEDDFAPTWTGYIPVPGDEGAQFAFDVRNKCDVPATLSLFSQEWSVDKGATATVRGAIDGVEGEQTEIGPGSDATTRIVLKQQVLPKNIATPIEYIVGIPRAEEIQGFVINGGWGMVLTEDAPAAVAPGAPTDLTLSGAEIEAGTPVTVSGKAEPGSNVTVTGGGATCAATADAAGAFSCDLTITTPGDHDITAKASNSAGAGSASIPVAVKVTPASTDPGDGGGSSAGSLGSLGSMDFLGSLSGLGG